MADVSTVSSQFVAIAEKDSRLAGDDILLEDADLQVVKNCLGLGGDGENSGNVSSPKKCGDASELPGDASRSANPESLSGLTFDFRRQVFRRIADHWLFTSIFMFLTFYALFVPDLDQLFGDKTSRMFFLVLNSFVCLLFMVEIVVQSLGKDEYVLRAYFWLDIIALISLLPDTWAMQTLLGDDEGFVAGRSSRLARIIRVASRSSKATRMQRLTKLARVASMLPKLGKLFGHRVQDAEVQVVLNKKLNRIFRLFDDDMDGWVLTTKVTKFLASMKVDIRKQSKRISQVQNPTSIEHLRNVGEQSPTFSLTLGSSMSVKTGDTGNTERASVNSVSAQTAGKVRGTRIDFQETEEADDMAQVNFTEFSAMLVEDPIVGPSLHQAVDHQLRKTTNMNNITSRHSEYIAVRVALGVILLLALLGIVQPTTVDNTFHMGLENLAATMRLKFPNATAGDQVPELMHRQIAMWKKGNGDDNTAENLLWLDVRHLVFCDAFTNGEGNCTRQGNAPVYWQALRPSWKAMGDRVLDTTHRKNDMDRIASPNLEDHDFDDDLRNARTTAMAVIVDRGERQRQAAMSMLTTLLVICVILAGIVLLTKDLTLMSSSLLKPLRELADDMESLAQLQLAGAEDNEVKEINKGTDEIRQIRNTFEKMKKAIKSWGKYVPWPVVQMLLRANVEADLKVEEVECSIYFSDIAGFTTIVEGLPPEKSLLLLNRYFNDMTKVIDDHGGVVIEFIGDAILCIYGAPLVNVFHPSAAVKAALRMLQSLRKINCWSQSKGMPEIQIRCGVHTGNVLVGNMGFQSRIKYGIVGEDAQIPSRLEEMNKTYTSKCLISNYTYEKLLPDHFLTRPIDFIKLRNEPGAPPEHVHQVMDRERTGDRSHSLWPACDLHAEAMELYMSREFSKALPKFEEVGDMVKAINEVERDGPTELLITRCQAYIKDPPPVDGCWDGVWDRSAE